MISKKLYCVSLHKGKSTCWSKGLYGTTPLLPPATKLGQGNIFRSVCQQFCPQGGHAWFYSGGCVVLFGGACVVLFGGACVVLFGGACVVLFGGVCVVLFGGGAWFYLGGCAWFYSAGGACVVFSVFPDTMRYGQWAGGTHPTGMHSCIVLETLS